MADGATLGNAYIQILPSMDGTKGKLMGFLDKEGSEAGDKAGDTTGTSLMSKLKSSVVKMAGTLAIGKTITDSLQIGADLEQQIGGIETMFGESAEKMRSYAESAYKTCGLSANNYMRQATSFSASLLQSLGGDTAKASDYANRAMIDMSDNANKMGSDIDTLQRAYSNFAKGQFQMLDSLSLGYGGTKEEMARLIHDASQMTDVQKELNLTVDDGDMSFANIVNAISVMQSQMGIAGTTAKEAATTFSGSFASMKAAAENFLGALMLNGKDGVDIAQTIAPLIETTCTFLFDNLIPAVGRVIAAIPPAIGTFLTEGLPIILQSVGDLVTQVTEGANQFMEGFKQTGLTSVANFVNGIIEHIPDGITAFGDFINGAIEFILTNEPIFREKGVELILSVVQGIVQNLPNAINAFVGFITNLVDTITTNLPSFLQKGLEIVINLANGIIQNIPQLVQGLTEGLLQLINLCVTKAPEFLSEGVKLIGQLAGGLIQAIPNLIGKCAEVIGKIVEQFASYDWLAIGSDLLTKIQEGIMSCVSALLTTLGEILTSIGEAVGECWHSIKEATSNIWESIKEFVSTLWQSIKDKASEIWTAIKDKIAEIAGNIKDAIEEKFNKAKEKITEIWNAVKDKVSEIWNSIKDKISETVNAIKDALAEKFNAAKDKVVEIFNAIKNKASEIWNGIKDKISTVVGSIRDKIKEVFDGVKSKIETVFTSIKTIAETTWGKIKDAITGPIEKAKEIVKGIVDTIKGFFNFTISWPKIPLPHFSIAPKGWSVGDLLKGKIPSLGIDWYAKAMDNPYMLSKASLIGVGEAGDEVVYGHRQLMSDIRNAVAEGGINNYAEPTHITINVYASEDMDERKLAEKVSEVLDDQFRRKEYAFR